MKNENQTITSIEEENRHLKAQLTLLRSVAKLFEKPAEERDISACIASITQQCLKITDADQGALLLLDQEEKHEPKTFIRHSKSSEVVLNHVLNLYLTGLVLKKKDGVILNNLPHDLQIIPSHKRYTKISSILSVPLAVGDKILGVLHLARIQKKVAFGDAEHQFLKPLSGIFAGFIQEISQREKLKRQTEILKKELQQQEGRGKIIGQSTAMQQVFHLLDRTIPTEVSVLITGESGTGKELVARSIHYGGPRAKNKFIAIDCGGLNEQLLEAELFGYCRGAFTGAYQDKQGLFEAANGGTLFLDELTNLPLNLQAKLLRVLQEREVRPVGASESRKVDVRVIAAANDLTSQIKVGEFREDLYYRLNVMEIHLPPLRERGEDIPLLATAFLNNLQERYSRHGLHFSPETVNILQNYAWPGNIRQLMNAIERLVLLTPDAQHALNPDFLPPTILSGSNPPSNLTSLSHSPKAEKRQLIIDVLKNNGWNQSAAARELGISERTIRYQMKVLDIKKP